MTDEERLDKEIEEGYWTVLRAKADWLEEQGDLVTAKGYRWLANHKKFPIRINDQLWVWEYYDEQEEGLALYSYFLPGQVYASIRMVAQSREYSLGGAKWPIGLGEAFRLAAVYTGEWLEDKEQPDEPTVVDGKHQ